MGEYFDWQLTKSSGFLNFNWSELFWISDRSSLRKPVYSVVGNQWSRNRFQFCTWVGIRLATSHLMLKKFRAYQLAIQFYQLCSEVTCTTFLKDQLGRASASIALNLSEGSAQSTRKHRRKYYYTAMGSLRECQTVLDLINHPKDSEVNLIGDQLGANLFKLCKAMSEHPESENWSWTGTDFYFTEFCWPEFKSKAVGDWPWRFRSQINYMR